MTLRKIKNADGSTTLFLDYRHNGKRMREYLPHLKLVKTVTPSDRQDNREKLQTAEAILIKKKIQFQSDEFEVVPNFKRGIDFIQFFEKYVISYTKKDRRVIVACFGKFKEFMITLDIKTLSTKQMNEAIVNDFKEYLESNLHGETPSNYFKKFKKLLKHGVREKIFIKNPAEEITITRGNSIKKDILNADEIQKLASTPLTNDDIKRAFLFSCNTGLRFCDIKVLQWRHIQGSQLKITQQKTNIPLNIPLNKNAQQILGNPGNRENLVFLLPSHTACLKNLRSWCQKAKINKHVTWHCARHSFATNMIYYGSDVYTASSNLGHSSLTYTQRYLREAQSLKERAVDNLPTIIL